MANWDTTLLLMWWLWYSSSIKVLQSLALGFRLLRFLSSFQQTYIHSQSSPGCKRHIGYYPLRAWRACHPRARAIKLFTRTRPQPIRAHSARAICAYSSYRRSRVYHFYPPSQILCVHTTSHLFCLFFVCFFVPFAFRAGNDARAGARDTKFISVITDEHKAVNYSYSYGKCRRLLSI